MNKHLFFKILTAWFLLTQAFPPYYYFVPMGGASVLSGFVGGSLLLFPNLLTKKSVAALIVYGLITFFYYLNGNAFFSSMNLVIVPFLHMMAAMIILEYTLTYDKAYKYTKLVVFEIVALNLIMAFISIPQLMINRNIIRGASVSGMEDAEEQVYYWVMSYATVHGLPILMAALVFLCRKVYRISKTLFAFWLFVAVSLYVIVFQSNATTSFLLSTMLVVIALVFGIERFTRQNIAKVTTVALLSLLMTSPLVLVPVIEVAQSVMSTSSDNYTKMDEIKDGIVYGEASGDYAGRQTLYEKSSKLFWESPLTGTQTPQKISHHTYIIDRLALFGVFMIIPLVLVFVLNIKSVYRHLRRTKVPYAFGIAGLLFMLYMKNDFGSGTWLYGFAVLPLLCRYIDYVLDNNTNKRFVK